MSDRPAVKIRLRLPSGAEIEAEGSQEFVRAEREAFLASQGSAPEAAAHGPGKGWQVQPPAWDSIIESRGKGLQLRAKLKEERTEKDACLVLLAAAHKLLSLAKPTATQLAKWLRASGYPVQRMDRAISEALEKGEILASGSRRSRRYELTGPGRLKAFILAQELSARVGAPG